MKIEYFKKKNIFNSQADAIINTVNCVGVSGAGLALQVKKRHPDVYKKYKNACDSNLFKPGDIQVIKVFGFDYLYVINFATKNHWKNPSEYSHVLKGLQKLSLLNSRGFSDIETIAIPKLGCGLGGLSWTQVHKFILDSEVAKTKTLHLYV